MGCWGAYCCCGYAGWACCMPGCWGWFMARSAGDWCSITYSNSFGAFMPGFASPKPVNVAVKRSPGRTSAAFLSPALCNA